MPKVKTNRSAAKRLKVTGTGLVARHSAYVGHKKLSKSAKQKRRLRQGALVSAAEQKRIHRLIPYM
ncbi:MAG: 50S ribosomal protein L35 [Bacillota bacterium]